MEIESYKVLEQLKSRHIEQGIMDLPDSPDLNQLVPLYNIFNDLRASLLSSLHNDFVKLIHVDLELKKVEFFSQDDHAQGLCYCYYKFNIVGEPESFLIARLLPFHDKILIHLNKPVSIKDFPKKLNTTLIDSPVSISELA